MKKGEQRSRDPDLSHKAFHYQLLSDLGLDFLLFPSLMRGQDVTFPGAGPSLHDDEGNINAISFGISLSYLV